MITKNELKRLFDKNTVHDYINSVQGNIGGEPAVCYLTDNFDITGNIGGESAVLFITDNFAYFKAKDGGNYNVISKMLDLKVDMINPSAKRVITDNIVTLYR